MARVVDSVGDVAVRGRDGGLFGDGQVSLSWDWYTDPAIFALEQERIFRRSWQFAGLTSQIPKPGDFLTVRRGGEIAVVVVRDEGGRINAFANVCRHRGSLIIHEEQGHAMTLQCPYHAWTYGLDGCLKKAPRSERNADFDPAGIRLFELKTYTFGPLIFVSEDLETRPFEDLFGGWMDAIVRTGVDLDAVANLSVTQTVEIESNWKLICENNFECYHCPTNHPSVRPYLDVHADSVYEGHDYFFYYYPQPKKTSKPGRASETKREPKVRSTARATSLPRELSSFLWPNFIFIPLTAGQPGGAGGLLLGRLDPLDVRRSLFERYYCFPDDVPEQDRREFIDFIEVVQAEDAVLCANAQRGLNLGQSDKHLLMLPNTEPMIRHFARLVQNALAAAAEPNLTSPTLKGT